MSTRRSSPPPTAKGAGEQFLVTTLDVNKPPRHSDGAVDFTKDFFGKPAYLTVSGQLNGETLACALSDVYTFGPTFRAENSNTSRHLAEFWMIEPEMAFADLKDDMECAEVLSQILSSAMSSNNCAEDMEFFDAFIEKGLHRALQHVAETPFAHLTYTEAVEILKKSGKTFQFPVEWGTDLQSEHERYPRGRTLQKTGDPHRLSRQDQSLLHARQRRRQNGRRHGRARPQNRRDHRRQPARRAPRPPREKDRRLRP